jgi:co-chaperonin GroES (HSP10)
MMVPINGKIFVERLEKRKEEGQFSSFGQLLQSNNSLGTIIMLEQTEQASKFGISKGCTVYFGNKVEKIFMDGREVMVMDFDNIFAVVRSDANA